MNIICGCATDIGSSRKNNQDGIFVRYIRKKKQCFAVCAVCDGIGGMEHGEVASGFIIRELGEWFEDISKWIDVSTTDEEVLFSHLKDGVETWNENLFLYARENIMRTGTTLAVLMLIRQNYFIINVGDSRIYRYNKQLEQLTTDDSVTKIKNGRTKAYLTNYMGKSDELCFQQQSGVVAEGDLFLVCSDGLYHHLDENDVADISNQCSKRINMDKMCNDLIHTVMKRGERDNISAGIIAVSGKV